MCLALAFLPEIRVGSEYANQKWGRGGEIKTGQREVGCCDVVRCVCGGGGG